MSSFGERLRRERESRNRSVEEISTATGIRSDYLEALEGNRFDALPGRAFGKLYIRAYAEILEFDPLPLIEQYDRERRQTQIDEAEQAPPDPIPARPVETLIARWRRARLESREAAIARAAAAAAHEPGLARAPLLEAAPARTGDAFAPEEAGPALPAEAVEPPGIAVPLAMRREASTGGRVRSTRSTAFALALLGLIVVAGGLYWALFKPEIEAGGSPGPARPPERAAVLVPPAAVPRAGPELRPAPEPARPVDRRPPDTRRASPVRQATAPGSFSIPEFGVGRRVVRRRLVEPSDQFTQWERVWFSTRVTGAAPGTVIRHVWLREGRAVQSMALVVNGADWRTHSHKTLGQPGRWSVEARDEEGAVLASSSFTCVPASR